MPTTGKVWGIAAAIIVGFLIVAFFLYQVSFEPKGLTVCSPFLLKPCSAFLLKVADSLINGAIVGVFVVMLRWAFGLPKVVAALERLTANSRTPDPRSN